MLKVLVCTVLKMVDRVVTVCIDGVNMRVNPMQPLKVCYVTDDDLPVAKRSAAVLARYNEVSSTSFTYYFLFLVFSVAFLIL